MSLCGKIYFSHTIQFLGLVWSIPFALLSSTFSANLPLKFHIDYVYRDSFRTVERNVCDAMLILWKRRGENEKVSTYTKVSNYVRYNVESMWIEAMNCDWGRRRRNDEEKFSLLINENKANWSICVMFKQIGNLAISCFMLKKVYFFFILFCWFFCAPNISKMLRMSIV